jgi:uncharacterized protein (DUF4415 family)
MRREGNSVIYTDQELTEMNERGESRTDWERLRAMSDEEIEANADADEESHGEWVPVSDALAIAFGRPMPLIDAEVIAWFASKDANYIQRINDVLRDYIKAQETLSSAAD